MSHPVAAGKSSFDHIDAELALSLIISDSASTYLDLACGAGRYALALAERIGSGGVVRGLDLWQEGVEALNAAAAERGLTNVSARVADLTAPLPVPDASVDVCLLATILHDLPEESRPGLLNEVRRMLVPGGRVVVIEFKKLDHGPGPRKDKRIGPEDAEALMAGLGFSLELTESLGEFPYLSRFVLAD